MFDVEELVDLLRIEGMKDICVIKVPASQTYVDYLVLTTGRSLRQLKAVAYYIRWAVSLPNLIFVGYTNVLIMLIDKFFFFQVD